MGNADGTLQTRRNYHAAIDAFQIALRTDEDDHMSWLRLGEAYSKAGKYAAASKALEHARELDPEDWVASYFIGEVQRQMGAYEDAITAFQSILSNLVNCWDDGRSTRYVYSGLQWRV